MISISSPVLAGYQDDPAFTGGGSSSYNPDNAMHRLRTMPCTD
jgi:hypothetical protein